MLIFVYPVGTRFQYQRKLIIDFPELLSLRKALNYSTPNLRKHNFIKIFFQDQKFSTQFQKYAFNSRFINTFNNRSFNWTLIYLLWFSHIENNSIANDITWPDINFWYVVFILLKYLTNTSVYNLRCKNMTW